MEDVGELSEYTDSAHTEVEDVGELSEYTDSAHTEVEDVGELSEYTDSAHTEAKRHSSVVGSTPGVIPHAGPTE